MPKEIKVPTSWESVAAMDPIDVAELLDKKDAEIERLREALTDVCGVGSDVNIMLKVAADALRHKP